VKPLDVLAQQIVAEVAAREWDEQSLYALLRGRIRIAISSAPNSMKSCACWPRATARAAAGAGALIHHDGVNHLVKGRRGARLTALTSGGTIPDNADYQVILEPQAQFVGTVNEDFAVESLQGDVFQLGNVSYRILRVEQGRIRVEDARGEPPSIPFWLGEAPGRTDELSASVSRLRWSSRRGWMRDSRRRRSGSRRSGHRSTRCAAAGELSGRRTGRARGAADQQTVIFERFFDEAGGMQLVIHSPFGSRINRAWGLALRKRSALVQPRAAGGGDRGHHRVVADDGAHSFELAEVARYLHSNTVRPLLVQALCAAPMFPVRWRWSAAIALALPRFRGRRSAGTARAHGGGRPAERGVSGPGRVRRESPGRARDSGSSAGAPDDPRLSRRGDGLSRDSSGCCALWSRAASRQSRAI